MNNNNILCGSNQNISTEVIDHNSITVSYQNKSDLPQTSGRAFTSLNNILNQLEQNPDLLNSPQELEKISNIANYIYSRYETRYKGSFQSFLDIFTCCFSRETELTKIDNLRNTILLKLQPKAVPRQSKTVQRQPEAVQKQAIASNSAASRNEKPQNLKNNHLDLMAFKNDLVKNMNQTGLTWEDIECIMRNILSFKLSGADNCPDTLFNSLNLSENNKTEIKKLFFKAKDHSLDTLVKIDLNLFAQFLQKLISDKILDKKSLSPLLEAAHLSKNNPLYFKNKLATNPILTDSSLRTTIFGLYMQSAEVSKSTEEEHVPITIEKGPGFPDVSKQKKDEVRAKTLKKLETYVDMSSLKLTEEGKKLSPIFKYIKFIPRIEGPTKSFISEGDLVQTPVKMEYNENFERMESKNFFFMHSTPAPCARPPSAQRPATGKTYKMDTKEGYAEYLNDMESVIYQSFDAQIKSGAEHILWNYFGMGAFLRDTFKDSKQMEQLRFDIAKRFVKAFEKAIVNNNTINQDFKFYLTGPTGENLTPDSAMEKEARDNYQAFTEAFKECHYKGKVLFCPETDAYVKGQQLADTYKIEENEVAPVSVINAADPKLLGNKWYEGFSRNGQSFNANYAIDENAHRRSSIMALISFLINGGNTLNGKAKGTCSKNIELLQKL